MYTFTQKCRNAAFFYIFFTGLVVQYYIICKTKENAMTPEIIIALSIFVLAFVSFIINKIP